MTFEEGDEQHDDYEEDKSLYFIGRMISKLMMMIDNAYLLSEDENDYLWGSVICSQLHRQNLYTRYKIYFIVIEKFYSTI